MKQAYLAPKLLKVYVTFYCERTSYSEPVSHTHEVGGAVHSLAWAKHIGRIAAGYDGSFEVFEHDCGDWIRIEERPETVDKWHDWEGDYPL